MDVYIDIFIVFALHMYICMLVLFVLEIIQDLEYLEAVWELTQEWNMAWDSWKVGTFASLRTDDMGFQAQGMLKKINKLARELKVCVHAILSEICICLYSI